MKYLVLALLAACGDQAASTAFEVHDTIHWSAGTTPDVVEFRVDGELIASDRWIYIDETYPSYADAKREFVPRTLELTTTYTTFTKVVAVGNCDDFPPEPDHGVVTLEAFEYAAWRGYAQSTALGADRGTCGWSNGSFATSISD